MNNRQVVILFGLAATMACACASAVAQTPQNRLTSGIDPVVPQATAPGVSRAGSAPATMATPAVSSKPTAGADQQDYILGPGDKLRIGVFGEETLSGEFTIAGNGSLSFPLIGEIPASGITVEALRAKLQTGLRAGYLKDPRVSAEVLSFRPYYLIGEVSRPGSYPFSESITVMDAIASAGGFSYRANRSHVFVKHASDPKEYKVKLTNTLPLAPGDTVRVVERYF